MRVSKSSGHLRRSGDKQRRLLVDNDRIASGGV